LGLGLTDEEIMKLRQQADTNNDGVIEWAEMVAVLEPLLGKYWQANLHSSSEYDQWLELHWETHSVIKRDESGYHRKGKSFYVNKLTGETTWETPDILVKKPSLMMRKKERSQGSAPTLEDFLKHAFLKHSSSGTDLTTFEMRTALTDIHIQPKLTETELDRLVAEADVDKNGVVDWQEFVHMLTPKLYAVFHDRSDSNAWVALDHEHEDGESYVYWHNRETGETTWTNPYE